jgi:long-chain acyl-CoA synthetase
MEAVMNRLVDQAAERFGDQTAVVFGERSITFNDVRDRTACFAGGLRNLGIERGDRVILHLPNCDAWIVAYHAIARLGAVVVPANFLLSIEEVAAMALDSGAKALIAPGDRCTTIKAKTVNDQATLPVLIPFGINTGLGTADFDQLLQSPPVEAVSVEPDDLFTIGYTSGTSGTPKGAMLTHRCVFMSTALTATIHVRHPGETVVSALPFPHVYGNVVMNAALLAGMKLVVLERFDVAAALRAIESHRATLFEGVPTMYYYILAVPNLADFDLSSVTRCTVGGQTIPTPSIEAVERVFGCPLLELWGMTEVAGPAISHSPYVPGRPGSIGQAFPGMQAKVVDLNDPARTLPAGEPGELMVRGPLVMRGYYNNDEATRAALTTDAWLHTGDIAYQDQDGYFFVVDRKKDLIITAGYNVYPAELERVIAMHPSVAMVAVTSVSDPAKGELAKAFVVLRPQAEATEEDLLAHCRLHLAAYKVPRLLEFVEDLPKTSTGKILRRELRNR